jgi:dipeptidyl aminopeptidase/acylaminoacyl peptidase
VTDGLRITDLDWRPDAGEIAFSSKHEQDCSIYEVDIYAIQPDGSDYRRITNSPACAALAAYPKGRVTVTLRNATTRSPLVVYVQGALEVQEVHVPPGGSTIVTFPQVADFGAGVLQQAVVSWAAHRWTTPIALADVQPNQTVHAGTLEVAGDGTRDLGEQGPSWHRDGSRLGFIIGGCRDMGHISARPPIGTTGSYLLQLRDVPACVLDWGPTPARANQVLYWIYRQGFVVGGGIYLVTEGSNTMGTKVVSTPDEEYVIDVQWLPDASGFLFTMGNGNYANIYHYDFATGDMAQLTSFSDEFAVDVSASPDSEWIVFERSPTNTFSSADLWLMRLDGSDMQLLVENGARPSWSQRAPPPPLTARGYMGFVMR